MSGFGPPESENGLNSYSHFSGKKRHSDGECPVFVAFMRNGHCQCGCQRGFEMGKGAGGWSPDVFILPVFSWLSRTENHTSEMLFSALKQII